MNILEEIVDEQFDIVLLHTGHIIAVWQSQFNLHRIPNDVAGESVFCFSIFLSSSCSITWDALDHVCQSSLHPLCEKSCHHRREEDAEGFRELPEGKFL